MGLNYECTYEHAYQPTVFSGQNYLRFVVCFCIQHFPDHKALRPITSPATAATDAVVKPTMTSKAVLDVRCVVCGVHMAAEVHNVHVWVCEQATDRDAIVAHATDPIRWVVGQNDELGARLLRSLHPTL